MTLTQTVTRAAATAAAAAEEFLQSDHKSVTNSKDVKEDDETLEKDNCKRDIVEWISRLRKPPSINKDTVGRIAQQHLLGILADYVTNNTGV